MTPVILMAEPRDFQNGILTVVAIDTLWIYRRYRNAKGKKRRINKSLVTENDAKGPMF